MTGELKNLYQKMLDNSMDGLYRLREEDSWDQVSQLEEQGLVTRPYKASYPNLCVPDRSKR